jgi:hypothetical protein
LVSSSSPPFAGATDKANGDTGTADAPSHETIKKGGGGQAALRAKANSVQSASISGDAADQDGGANLGSSNGGALFSNGDALALGCAMLACQACLFVGTTGDGVDGWNGAATLIPLLLHAISFICLLGLGLCVARRLKASRLPPSPLPSLLLLLSSVSCGHGRGALGWRVGANVNP